MTTRTDHDNGVLVRVTKNGGRGSLRRETMAFDVDGSIRFAEFYRSGEKWEFNCLSNPKLTRAELAALAAAFPVTKP